MSKTTNTVNPSTWNQKTQSGVKRKQGKQVSHNTRPSQKLKAQQRNQAKALAKQRQRNGNT